MRYTPIKQWPKFTKKFVKDESGNASVESLFWVPIFMFMLVMIVDASFVFHGKTQALRALQDSNRAFAVGRFATTSELKAAALVELNKFSPNASVTSTTNAGIVTTVATFPAKDLMSIGSISAISDVNVTVVSKQYIES